VALSTNHRAIRWLRAQLPELVAGRVITDENAAAIERHYAAAEARSTNFGFLILAGIGSTLVGAGVILLIAHNWDELSRPARCVLAFLPLVSALALGFFVLLRRNGSAPWREAAAIFDIAAVGAAISLVSQTYQIQGSFADFMRVWLLLSIPIVYIFRTNFGALAYIIGTTAWVINKSFWSSVQPGEAFFWLFLLLVIPYYVSVARKGKTGWAFRTLSLALVGAGAFGLGSTVDFARTDTGAVAFAGFFALVYLVGMMWQEKGESLNTLTLLGGIGIAVTALVSSFGDIWRLRTDLSWSQHSLEQQVATIIALFFPAAAILLAGRSLLRGQVFYSVAAASIPLVAICARLIAFFAQDTTWPALLFNVYTLILGIEFIVRGIRVESVARANFGLLIIAGLAFARFFDSDLSFVARGIGFIVVGAAFLIANLLFFRRRTLA
jgi:uncharacterized membrane protein